MLRLSLDSLCVFQILPMVPKIVNVWKEDNSEQSQKLLLKLTELLHVLMYLHAGFPELYDPVYEMIKVRLT